LTKPTFTTPILLLTSLLLQKCLSYFFAKVL
jgi:hypothetical protein